MSEILITTVLIGIGATVVMDLWSLIRKAILGVQLPNYGLVGRWIAYLPGEGANKSYGYSGSQPIG